MRRSTIALTLVLANAHFAADTQAEWQFAPAPGIKASGSVELGFAAVSAPGTNFGAGRVNPHTGLASGDPTWGEAYVLPALDWSTENVGRGQWYGRLSAVGAVTLGDGDPGGYSAGGDGEIDIEDAIIGWRSAIPGGDASQPVFDLSFGRQEINIGDGFLIDDGNFDFGDNSGVWLVPRQAFQRTAIGRVDYRALHTDLFYLEPDSDYDESAIAGANLEYRFALQGHLGLLFFTVVDTDSPRFFGPRDGMDVVSARINDFHPLAIPQIALWGEYARQSGRGRDGRFDAGAWYGEVIYTFTTARWTPSVSYRYAYFSGDADPTDATRRDFDGFFYGYDQRGWGTWFQGEVTGGWLLFNNNQRNHLVKITALPSESVTTGVIVGTFHLNEANYLGIPVTADHFGDEINLYADWIVNEHATISAAYGVLFPGDAAIQAFGDNESYHIIEVGLWLSF
ncbi:MAG: alginate export family protein [Gammaproteobacteria bacterium]